MRKKLFTALLAFSMVISGIPVSADAAERNAQTVKIDGVTYTVTSLEKGAEPAEGQIQIAGTDVCYQADQEESLSDTTYYGTATLSFSEYYAKETSVEEYDVVSSATSSKNTIFPNEDSTEVTEDGYQILGVKNVAVAVNARTYVESQLLEAVDALPESGVYAEAAGITLNEDKTAKVAQAKTLEADGSYAAREYNVVDTVTDAAAVLKTTSVWGAYEIDIKENSTSYIRNTREDEGFAIGSQIQGLIVETTDGTRVGLRYTEEIWVQPYEFSFQLNTIAAQQLIGKTVSKVTYLMPDSAYVYEFEGVYLPEQLADSNSVSAYTTTDANTVVINTGKLPEDVENLKATISYVEGSGRNKVTTYYATDAAVAENGTVKTDTALESGREYNVLLTSDNYADLTVATGAKTIVIANREYYSVSFEGLAPELVDTVVCYVNGEKLDISGTFDQANGEGVYYLAVDGQEKPEGWYYGTSTLSYTDFYAGATSVAEYDAVSSATTTKNNIFPNEDSTEVTESGYRILGVKNVSIAVDAKLYTEAAILAAAGESLTGAYAQAAAVALNEDPTAKPAQYKTLDENGYGETVYHVADTVTDATAVLKTTSVWGDYEIDITENSTSYIRNTREDTGFAIGSQIQGIIVETTDGTKVGLRHTEEIWVQPYEFSFYLNTAAAENLIGKTVNKVTYLMPDAVYIYEFADGVYVKPQLPQENKFTAAFAPDLTAVQVDLSGLPADIANVKASVSYKEGRKTTYFAQDTVPVNGTVALNITEEQSIVTGNTYTVIISSDNYADISVGVTAPEKQAIVPASSASAAPSGTPAVSTTNSGVSSTAAPASKASVTKVAVPKQVKVKSTGKKKIKVSWKKVAKADGYQVRYSLKKSMKKAKKVAVKKSKTSVVIKKLKAKKKYYVQVRAYRKVDGEKVYSKWSSKKAVKVKK